MPATVLREYQERGVQLFRTLPRPARFFFAWDMGAGKTLGAIAVARTYERNRTLIVCPAIVRQSWARELAKHWPERSVGVIDCGLARKLSKKKTAERDAAYAADVQIVSYDLLGSVRASDWDMVIVDEFHNLRSVTSKQSKLVRGLFQANPQAWALGLSGTPIPNEAAQLWNPVDTFFPGRWGNRSRNYPNSVPFQFLSRYCLREENEHGTKFYGLQETRRAELASRFASVSQRVVQKDFAKFLPPLFVEALHLSAKPDPVKIALDWLRDLGTEVEHVGIYTHLRETAYAIAQALDRTCTRPAFVITGASSATERDAELRRAKERNSSVIVGTTHALKEGISLSFQKAALVVEWTTEVAQVTQFIGRFGRQDSTSQIPTRVQFVVGPNDVDAAATLSRRIADIQAVVKSSRADEAAALIFAARELSTEEYESQLQFLIASNSKRRALWGAEEDDSDDE